MGVSATGEKALAGFTFRFPLSRPRAPYTKGRRYYSAAAARASVRQEFT